MIKIIRILFFFLFQFLSTDFLISQTEFFKSNFPITNGNLENFYSSIQVTSDEIIFNCNNYNLYSINKVKQNLNWSTYIGRKSNTGLFTYDSLIITTQSKDNKENVIIISINNGLIKQITPVQSIETKPYFKNNIMYYTGINNFGQLIAYDIFNKKVVWEKFIAHGISKTPYYLKDQIICNAEADNWFYIDYNGNLVDTLCKDKFTGFIEGIPCMKQFLILTHDNISIDQKYLESKQKNIDINNIVYKQSETCTAVLDNNTLLIIENKKKLLNKIDLRKLKFNTNESLNSYKSILKIEGNVIWFCIDQRLIKYNFKNNELITAYDLEKWNPHQVLLDSNNTIWLISNNDGQLYGLKIK